mgnify:CR=1 FL=1
MNLPNKLTTVRLVSVPLFVIIYLIPYQSLGISMPTFDILSTQLSLLDIILFVIFGLSALTDYLDGYLARKNNLVTTFGKFIDPIADKLIVNTALLLLASSNHITIVIPIIMILISLLFTAFPLSFDEVTLADKLPVTIGSLICLILGEVIIRVKKIKK